MSLLFSRVTAMSKKKVSIFLVGGKPHASSDLESWTAYRSFLEGIGNHDPIIAHVEAFTYGDEEPVDATPEEVAYLYMRMEKRPDFIDSRTNKLDEYDFVISGN